MNSHHIYLLHEQRVVVRVENTYENGAIGLDLPYTSTQSDIPSNLFSPSLILHLEHTPLLLVDPPIHHVLAQSRIKQLTLAQNPDGSDLVLPRKDHCSRDAFASGALEPIAASTGRRHVQCRFAAKVAGVENFEDIEFATAGGPAVQGGEVSVFFFEAIRLRDEMALEGQVEFLF